MNIICASENLILMKNFVSNKKFMAKSLIVLRLPLHSCLSMYHFYQRENFQIFLSKPQSTNETVKDVKKKKEEKTFVRLFHSVMINGLGERPSRK